MHAFMNGSLDVMLIKQLYVRFENLDFKKEHSFCEYSVIVLKIEILEI